MTLQQLQNWVANDWEQHSKEMPSVELQLLYMMEESGEVAEAIRKTNGAKARKDVKVDLGSEMADLIVAITTLANHFDIDLTSEISHFQRRLAERHAQGF